MTRFDYWPLETPTPTHVRTQTADQILETLAGYCARINDSRHQGGRMPIPEFVVELRRHVGHAPLWLIGVTSVVLRERDGVQTADRRGRDDTNAARPEGSRRSAGGVEVLLVRRSDNGAWAPVTGIVDPGEDPHVAAIREVAEETGVTAEIERLVWVSAGDLVTHVNGDQARYLDHTFACRWVAGEPVVGDDESLETRWWPLEALPDMPQMFAARIAAVLAQEPGVRLGNE